MLQTRADRARDQGRFQTAALLYAECVELAPRRHDLAVQCGHMFKEAGRFADAERHYRLAIEGLPDDADLALQLGHLLKTMGRRDEAYRAYGRAAALALEPGEAEEELGRLSAHAATAEGARPLAPPTGLAPRRPADLIVIAEEAIVVSRLGRRERGASGLRRTMRGVEAIHGYVLSRTQVTGIAVIVNGMTMASGPLRGGYRLASAEAADTIRRYVFNYWIDVSAFAAGLHAVELRFEDTDGKRRSWHDTVAIDTAVPASLYPDSDTLVDPPPDHERTLEAAIRARPSRVHRARRTLYPAGIDRVLVIRTDQLGDLVASIPGLRRLRQMLPKARIVGLVTAANAGLAATLGDLLDEVIAIDFPDDPVERRRIMTVAEQEALHSRLLPYRFDMAIDLSRSSVSRDLLLLSGAPFLCGGRDDDAPYLSLDVLFNTNDRWNGHDMTPHSVQTMALIEGIGAALASPAAILRRGDLSVARLAAFGIGDGERYGVLHLGARLAFSRWPYYSELARQMVERTELRVVVVTGGDGGLEGWPSDLLADPRLVVIDRMLPFDDLDALLSFAAVMVGNDSGPKHLASLRGTPVVTIFSARINWTEWGQENAGVIISRALPCAGCAIHHDPETCGKDFICITDIRADEVFAQVAALLAGPRPPPVVSDG